MTITDAAGFIRRGELTPTELLEQCLARVDRYEDRVRAWVYLDRDGAREQAERLTAELKQNNYRGPLHGTPIGIKDIIDVFDMPTGCGSKLWANSYARRDATVVERLRQAGAVIMGKTVTTAFASFDPPVTRNPWNVERTPGGSSSGSAAAVACGMCLGALASQTGGSITRPASYCGVCSIKPTYGRVSVDGVLPLAPSMDHVGAMANCVRDVAILFQTIAGPHSSQEPELCSHTPVDDCLREFGTVQDHLRRKTLKPEFAFLEGMFVELADAGTRSAIKTLANQLHDAGGWARHVALPSGFSEIVAEHRVVMAVEAAEYHAERKRRHPEDYPPRITELIEEGLGCPAVRYRSAQKLQYRLAEEVENIMNSVRFLACPATQGGAPAHDTTGNPVFNSPWSFTGQPTVSVPFARDTDGMPISLQLVGGENEEADLLSTAAFCEATIGFAPQAIPL